MKITQIISVASVCILGAAASLSWVTAQSNQRMQPTPTLRITLAPSLTPVQQELEVNEATNSSIQASESAMPVVVERVVEKKSDITEPKGEVQGRLERYLLSRPVQPLSITNFLQHAVRNAVMLGVPANTIVLVLLFPVVAAIIAASRHLIGLRGFGIFTPAVLSVAFVSTGVMVGILLFVVILIMANLGKRTMKRLKLQYMPRMALILWFMCLGLLGSLLFAPYLRLDSLMSLSIFPILTLVLLAENFIEVQLGKSRNEATELAMETILLALICSLVLSLDGVQKFAIVYPEILSLGVAVFDVFMGQYSGLRLSEYLKFRKIS